MSVRRSDSVVLEQCAAKEAAVPDEYRTNRKCAKCESAFVAHKNSRAEFCCMCAVANRRLYMQKRMGTGSDPLPGYPKNIVFETMDQVDAYLGHEKIECLICGRHYRALNTHIKRLHGIKDTTAYKMMHGIPTGRGLIGTATSALMVEHGKDIIRGLRKNGLFEDQINRMRRAPKTGAKAEDPPALKAKRSSLMKEIYETSPIVQALKNEGGGRMPWRCSDCGADIIVSEARLLLRRCENYCKRCRYERWKRSKQAWYDRNPSKKKEYQDRYRRKWPPSVTKS